jgi:hypothetical protein
MNSPRPPKKPADAAPMPAWHRLARVLAFGARLGIATRLSIAFCAVAVLAVAANAIIEHGTSMLRAVETAPVPAPVANAQSAPDLLPAALDRFNLAVLGRVESEQGQREQTYREAAAALATAHADYSTAIAPTLDDAASISLLARQSPPTSGLPTTSSAPRMPGAACRAS